MATGILIPNLLEIAYSISTPIIIARETAAIRAERGQFFEDQLFAPGGPWKPPQWAQPALTIVTVPPTATQVAQVQQAVTAGGNDTLLANTLAPAANNYVFDAVLRSLHRRVLKTTQHPVLTGANITDHAYVEPTRLTLEIGMSDAMAAFATGGEWVGWGSKSVSAWQIIKGWMTNRTLLTVQTRLDTYYNMLVEDCAAQDDVKTRYGLRATIVLGELIAATVDSRGPTVSARPQTSNSNPAGVVQGTLPSPDLLLQHAVPTSELTPFVPGAGTVSSLTLL